MFIMTDDTPNPDVKKFNVGREVCTFGTVRNYTHPDEASDSELAQSLFAHPHIKAVMFGHDFISVTKDSQNDVDWKSLRLDVIDIITDHFLAEKPVFNQTITESKHHEYDAENQEIVNQILELIETKVRPAVAQDGGDITFHGFSNGVVYLKMQGACSGCPSSAVTLKSGIENMLRHYIPEVLEVQPA